MKPFKNLKEQIAILKDRNLIFEDENSAELYLLHNNYYNIINIYSKLFQTTENKFIDGTSFKEIKNAHIFDSELKSILLKNVLNAEKIFKSIIAHRMSEKYPGNYEYLNTTIYTNNHSPIKVTKTIAMISNKINNLINDKQPNSVKHYYNVHNNVPLWVLINELEFGTVRHMYQTEDKTRNSVFSIISCLQCFLSKAEYTIMLNTILKRSQNLHRKLVTINTNDILSNYGFPKDWHIHTHKIKQ